MPEAVYSTAPPVGKSRTLAALYENSKFSQPKFHLLPRQLEDILPVQEARSMGTLWMVYNVVYYNVTHNIVSVYIYT